MKKLSDSLECIAYVYEQHKYVYCLQIELSVAFIKEANTRIWVSAAVFI